MSLRSDAREVLSAWRPPTPRQVGLRNRYVAHLAAEPNGVWRSCRPDHLTASVLVVSADLSRVLLTLHAKADRWFQLGGHLEPTDHTLMGAAHREATEESGVAGLVVDPVPVHLDEHEVGFCGGPGLVRHLDVRFVARAADGAAHSISEESHDVRWWPVDALPDPDPEMLELVDLAVERLGQSASGS